MIARLTSTMAGVTVWALSSRRARDRRTQIEFIATRLWNTADPADEVA